VQGPNVNGANTDLLMSSNTDLLMTHKPVEGWKINCPVLVNCSVLVPRKPGPAGHISTIL